MVRSRKTDLAGHTDGSSQSYQKRKSLLSLVGAIVCLPKKPDVLAGPARAALSTTCVPSSLKRTRYKRDEIAARQLHALPVYQAFREKKLLFSEVRTMFEQMRDHAWGPTGPRASSKDLVLPD